MIFYNPLTRPQFPCAVIAGEKPTDKNSPWYNLYVSDNYADKSREDVLAKDFTGPAHWWSDNGILYEGMSHGSWDCKPVTAETQPIHRPGTNWGEAYFVDEKSATNWANSLDGQHHAPIYHEVGDVWSVHFHY